MSGDGAEYPRQLTGDVQEAGLTRFSSMEATELIAIRQVMDLKCKWEMSLCDGLSLEGGMKGRFKY